jgi:hypothetical protein
MQKRLECLVMFSVTIVAAALYDSGKVLATEAEGYKSTSLAQGRFREIDVNSTFQGGQEAAGDKEARQVLHPGQSLVIVTAGTVTDYEGHDPECRPHVYTKGMGFVDPGGEHVHNLRNEGDVEARTIAVQFIPADAARRVDVADPGTCHFHR